MANIASEFFLTAGSTIAGLLRPGGILLGTGFYGTEADEVDRTLQASGLQTIGRESSEGWALSAYRSPGER